MWYYSTFNLATNYGHYALARVFQGLGYAFFFVPLNVVAYSELRPDQNNRASSLTNLFRNWGGSFGIAFITTASERRFDYHQSMVSAALPQTSGLLEQRVRALDRLSCSPWLLHRRCAQRRVGECLSATRRPGAFVGLHGLLPRTRMGNTGCCPSDVFHPPLPTQVGRRAATKPAFHFAM